jgi:Tol biopolymer transport system component
MSGLLDNLYRRGVLRVTVAYLAISWLVLQVIDLVSGILLWPNWVAQLSLVTLAVGFPIALLLAWFYDATPEGIREDTGEADVAVPTRFGGRRIDFVIIGALSFVIILLLVKDRFVPPASDSYPKVTDYERVTDSQLIMPPFPSPYPLVAGNGRLYFSTFETGRMSVKQVAMTGGDAEPVEMPDAGIGTLFRPVSTLPDGSGQVVVGFNPEAMSAKMWSIPFVGGSPRLIGAGGDGVYSPDGSKIAYIDMIANEISLFTADNDMSNPRVVAETSGPMKHWIRWSPDGRKLRYSVERDSRSIWEVDAESERTSPKPLLRDWEGVNHCCGEWTPDGKYYVFQGTQGKHTQLFAMRETGNLFGRDDPVQITDGALDYRRPTIAPDGKSLFAIGWQLQGETVAMDPASGQLRSMAVREDLSAEWVSFASDADRIAWLSYPDGDLWASRQDGRDRQQLTFDFSVLIPVVSPDGSQVAFTGEIGEEAWGVYVVPTAGGEAIRISPPDVPGFSSAWAPDGNRILFRARGRDNVQVYDLRTRTTSEFPGTDGLWNPNWSPSGRLLSGHRRDWLALYDVETEERRMLFEDRPFESAYWGEDDDSIYVVDPHTYGAERGIYRVDTGTGEEHLITKMGNKRAVFGDMGMWIGVTPEGEPMFTRDHSIHHIYKLSWLP